MADICGASGSQGPDFRRQLRLVDLWYLQASRMKDGDEDGQVGLAASD